MPLSARELRSLVGAARLVPADRDRLARKLYRWKQQQYRRSLLEMARRYGVPQRRVQLSPQIKQALREESDLNASRIVATYNKLIGDFVERNRHKRFDLLARELDTYMRERIRRRTPIIARNEIAGPRLDAMVNFFLENGVSPRFDFDGPPPICPTCVRLRRTQPHEIAVVLRVGRPHLNCTHWWAVRGVSGEELRRGGDRPGRISLGRRGETAGIVGGHLFVTEQGGQEDAVRALGGLGGTLGA